MTTGAESQMLPSFIIDQIRKREEDERRPPRERPALPIPEPIPREQKPADDEGDRGVVIIDLGADT